MGYTDYNGYLFQKRQDQTPTATEELNNALLRQHAVHRGGGAAYPNMGYWYNRKSGKYMYNTQAVPFWEFYGGYVMPNAKVTIYYKTVNSYIGTGPLKGSGPDDFVPYGTGKRPVVEYGATGGGVPQGGGGENNNRNPLEPFFMELNNQATINFLSGYDGACDNIGYTSGAVGTIAGFISIVRKTPGVNTAITVTTAYWSTVFFINGKLSGNILSNYNNIVDGKGDQLPREGVVVQVYPTLNSITGWTKSAAFYDKFTGKYLGNIPFY